MTVYRQTGGLVIIRKERRRGGLADILQLLRQLSSKEDFG
jgi:hypothetical protein